MSASVNLTSLSLATLQPVFGKVKQPCMCNAMARNDVIDILTSVNVNSYELYDFLYFPVKKSCPYNKILFASPYNTDFKYTHQDKNTNKQAEKE